jgi:hypothetical protein
MEAFASSVSEFKAQLAANLAELQTRVDAKLIESKRACAVVRAVYDVDEKSPQLGPLLAAKDVVDKELSTLEQELSRLQVATRRILSTIS